MSYALRLRATEPCDVADVQVCDINDDEATQVEGIIAWLEEHAGGEWGGCLCEWELSPSKATGGDLVGLDAVLGWLALNSRYDETDERGEFYGGARNAALDAYLDRV